MLLCGSDGSPLCQFANFPSGPSVRRICAASSGRYFLAGDSQGRVWKCDNTPSPQWKTVLEIANSPVRSIDVAPSDDLFVVGWANGTASVMEANTERERFRLEGGSKDVWTAFLPQKNEIFTLDASGVWRRWNAATGERLAQGLLHAPSAIECVAWNSQRTLLAAGYYDRTLRLWNFESLTPIKIFTGHRAAVIALAFSPDDRRLASVSKEGAVFFWDIERPAPLLQVDRYQFYNSLAFTPDGGALFLGGGNSDGFVFSTARNRRMETGKTVNLLAMIDPQQDALLGQWNSTPDGLHAAGDAAPQRLRLPVLVSGSYRIRSEFTYVQSGRRRTVGFILPVGQTHTLLCLDYEKHGLAGLERIDGRTVSPNEQNPTIQPLRLKEGQKYSLLVVVRLLDENVAIEVQIGGQPIIHWKGRRQSLGFYEENRRPVFLEPGSMALTLGNVEVLFHRLEVQIEDGEILTLRGREPADQKEGTALTKLLNPAAAQQVIPLVTDGGLPRHQPIARLVKMDLK